MYFVFIVTIKTKFNLKRKLGNEDSHAQLQSLSWPAVRTVENQESDNSLKEFSKHFASLRWQKKTNLLLIVHKK